MAIESWPATRPAVSRNGRRVGPAASASPSGAGGLGSGVEERPDQRPGGGCRLVGQVEVHGSGVGCQSPREFFSSLMSCGVRAAPARVANSVISYAMLPRFAVFAAITPRTEPLLIEETSR